MSKLAKALTAAAGNAGESLYVEDVFSTYLYEGTGAAHTITNGIDLSGEGGLTWIKTRNTGTSAWHSLSDTERGAGYILRSDLTNAQNFDTAEFTSFNSNGFTVGNDTQTNGSGRTYASWTFRKAKKFFDVVVYTGNSTSGRTVSHNLGSVPACIIIKRINNTSEWPIYHKDESSYGSTGEYEGRLNETTDFGWNYIDGTPTDAVFAVTADTAVNLTGETYVAYLFASDAGGFGDDGSENIIKCGSYTGDGGAGTTEVNLGFEPQWILVKATSAGDNGFIIDNMRGWATESNTSNDAYLLPNASNAEATGGFLDITATGFKTTLFSNVNVSGRTYVYVAIRRPMKTPESGTEVLAIDTSTSGNNPTFDASFPPDFAYITDVSGAVNRLAHTRLLQGTTLKINATGAEETYAQAKFDYMEGYCDSLGVTGWYGWMFKRGTGFMDVVAYQGTGSPTTVTHGLKVIPELIICKSRSASWDWAVYTATTGGGYYLRLNRTEGSAASSGNFPTAPTSSVFSVGTASNTNASGGSYISYLFATLAGVSKVGSYTGTGADLNVDCGFSAGARWIMIKRSDSTGDWYVWDSVRGITAGNDPYMLLNTAAAQVTNTDYIDPLSSGFTVTSSAPAALNASGGTYIFLAIA